MHKGPSLERGGGLGINALAVSILPVRKASHASLSLLPPAYQVYCECPFHIPGQTSDRRDAAARQQYTADGVNVIVSWQRKTLRISLPVSVGHLRPIFLSDVREESMQSSEPKYEIFSGRFPESVVGLAAARERMQTCAAQKPGPYFVFCTHSHAVLAIIDTAARRRVNEGAA
jgi:hypothetical protein